MHTGHFVGFVMWRLFYELQKNPVLSKMYATGKKKLKYDIKYRTYSKTGIMGSG